ncbi:IucA/IucC family protein [Sinomonas mesophila]|uniref:IucA/IucC family protein n=1 Tax=Sinomonas mesophila TaxID=1531955 RepID=UPI000987B0AF|nr:IucA/IucC family protein [Sinomonas mesophila]
MTASLLATGRVLDADTASAHTLLGCLVRETAGPDGQTALDAGHLLVRLPHLGELVRARVLRVSPVAAHRFTGPVQLYRSGEERGGEWEDLGLDALARLVGAELTARTGVPNEEFAAQAAASRDSLADILATRPAERTETSGMSGTPLEGAPALFVDSEQGLIAGHPRHPAPKWRSGDRAQWRRFSPEARTAFPLHWLAARAEHIVEHAADGPAVDGPSGSTPTPGFDGHAATARLLGESAARVPAGWKAVPVHPWQFELLRSDPRLGPVLEAALADGVLLDLGEVGLPLHPTASVRTLYQPEADVFLKTSLSVRITNCLRKNAEYELSGAVALTELLEAPLAEVSSRHAGFAVLPEPAARSVALPEGYGTAEDRHALLEGLGSIVRTGIAPHYDGDERVHLAASLAALPDCIPAGTRLAELMELNGPAVPAAWAREWWGRYLGLLVPPVLRLWAVHGIVLEPHLQNILVVLGEDSLPVRVLARDLEGTKLLTHRHADALAGLPAQIAENAGYDEERGWNRIAYCLFVNHLAEMAGALADLVPGEPAFEAELWDALGEAVAEASAELGEPARLRALLAGVPLPAKTNLMVRWQRRADRFAGYVPFPNPFGRAVPQEIR